MQINPGDGSGIVDEVLALGDTDLNNYKIADIIRRVNAADEEIVGLLINADGTWRFDDTNYTTLPIGLADLTEGQSSYTFQDQFLSVETVKVKDIYGHWHIIDPRDQSEMDIPLEDYLLVNDFPQFYVKEGNTINLYPAPAATVVATGVGNSGLKIEFQRTASVFTTTDTTKQPGFATPYHIILAYMAALPYCMTYKKDRVTLIQAKILELKKELIALYSRREKDRRKVMRMKPIRFR